MVQPEDGNTVMTTIDVNIQSIVEKAMLDWNEANRSVGEDGVTVKDGSLNTAALVMNPNNGAVLAMATYPTFDLNNPKDLSRYFTEDQVAAMSDEEQMDFLNRLWQNYTITHPFEPGSTFKPFTVAMGLETGKLSGNEAYYCDGYEQFGPSVSDRVHCFKRAGHGPENVEKALWDSCNDALMQMSYVIGPQVFAKYQSNFGFGQRTNIDLPGEADTSSLVFDEEALGRPINLATCSFGQSVNVTMMQLATGFCSLINGGYLYQPRVVDRILDSSGNVVETREPVVAKQPISEEVSALLKKYLLGVVTDGTAKTVQVEGYNTGGKTGTAQKIPRSAGTYVVSYISFAPAEHPEVLVYVIVDEPNVPEQDHSSYAMEINHNIMTQILPYLNIKTAEQEAAD